MKVERKEIMVNAKDLNIGDTFVYKDHVCLRVDTSLYEDELIDVYNIFFLDLHTNKLSAFNENLDVFVERIYAKVVCI